MKDNKLTTVINKPAQQVFEFTVDPDNTPKWIESIVEESVNEKPVKLGTIYKNLDITGRWVEYEMTAIQPDEFFVLSQVNSNFHVKYTFTELTSNKCKFEYHEWVDNGELDEPLAQEVIDKLKNVVELS